MKLEYISVSQINTFLRCPKQYYYRYVEGLKIPPSGAIVQGQTLHRANEYNFKHKMQNYEDVPLSILQEYSAEVFDQLAVEATWVSSAEKGEVKDKTIRSITAYRLNHAPKIMPQAVETEVKGEVVLSEEEKIPIIGYVDLIDSRNIIHDTKTASRKPPEDVAKNSLQLYAYAWLTGKKATVLDYVIAGKDVIIVEYPYKVTDNDIAFLQEIAKNVIKSIIAEIFPPNPNGWHCSEKFCGYYKLCRGRR